MNCLLDPTLFALDAAAWQSDPQSCLRSRAAIALHIPWFRQLGARLAWCDDFFAVFPWDQTGLPGELIDLCKVIMGFWGELKAKGLLVTDADLCQPKGQPAVVPDLVASDHLAGLRECWLALLGGLVSDRESADAGVAVATVDQPSAQGSGKLIVVNGPKIGALVIEVPLLRTDAEWRRFAGRRRLDLAGKSVAVLGGQRSQFERAKQELQEKHKLQSCSRLPPHYEESRTQQQTGARLQQVDLLVVCTSRLKHTDSDQISNLRRAGAITCEVVRIDNHTETHIIKAVIDHFGADL